MKFVPSKFDLKIYLPKYIKKIEDYIAHGFEI